MFRINVHCFQLLFLFRSPLKKEQFRLRIISYFHFHGHLVNHILDHLSSISGTVLALSSHPKVLPKTHQKTSPQDWRQNNKIWVKIRRRAGNMFGRSTGTEGVGDHPLRPKKRLMSFHWIHKHIHTKPIANVSEIIINKHNVFKVPRKKAEF